MNLSFISHNNLHALHVLHGSRSEQLGVVWAQLGVLLDKFGVILDKLGVIVDKVGSIKPPKILIFSMKTT